MHIKINTSVLYKDKKLLSSSRPASWYSFNASSQPTEHFLARILSSFLKSCCSLLHCFRQLPRPFCMWMGLAKYFLIVTQSPFFGSPLLEMYLHVLFSFVTTAAICVKAITVFSLVGIFLNHRSASFFVKVFE